MQGEVVYLYAFDVANEIATGRIGDILATRPTSYQIRASHTFPKDVPLYQPLVIEPPPLAATLGGRTVRQLVRVYEVGVVSVALRVSVQFDELAALAPFHQPVLDDGQSLDAAARQLCAEVCKSLRDALIQPAPHHDPEAYTVFCATDLAGAANAVDWLASQRRAVAELLTEAAPGTLSEMQIAEVLRVTRSYAQSDAVVIDWDAALAIDLDGYLDDVLYVIELANLQLEEYRVMDQRLDRYLDRVYDDLNRRRFGAFGAYTKTLGKLRLFRVDVTRLNDEVTHITKFFGDWYLARVYLGAAERFYLNQWRQSVENRLAQLDELYSVVNADVNNRRMVVLELLIVIFFAIDLVMLWLKK
jgi:hypothetical protein